MHRVGAVCNRALKSPVGALCKRALPDMVWISTVPVHLRLSESWILGARPFKGLACSRSRCLQGRVLESRAPHPVNPDSDNSSYFVTRHCVWGCGGRLRLPFGDAVPPANKMWLRRRVSTLCDTPASAVTRRHSKPHRAAGKCSRRGVK